MSEQDIFDYIHTILTSDHIKEKISNKELFGITSKEIADHFNLYRSTVTLTLNEAIKQGLYIKIDTRPALYVPVDLLQK